MIDLFLVSVLLDAGAGTEWGYTSKDNGKVYRRSEGLAVASLDMFKEVCQTEKDAVIEYWLIFNRVCFLAIPPTNSRLTLLD